MRYFGFLVAALALIAAGFWFTGQRAGEAQSRPAVASNANAASRGAAAFIGEGFGGISMHALDTNALPWKLTAAALVLQERQRNPDAPLDQATLEKVLKRFGFLYPKRIANMPDDVAWVSSDMPLGMSFGDIAPIGGSHIAVTNLSCAACHASVTYAADGSPEPDEAILGAPNTSIDLEAYTQAIFIAMRQFGDGDALLAAADSLYPDMNWQERQSLRFIVLPLAQRRMEGLADADRAMPFPNGTPGSTNGVAALKHALGVLLAGGGADDAGIVSVPDLGDRLWKTSLLADGAYSAPNANKGGNSVMRREDITTPHIRALAAITTFFTVPSMGVHPDAARSGLQDAEDIMAFLMAYQPQPFPGAVDNAASLRGSRVYAENCASCHGDYNMADGRVELVQYPNWIGDVGTDPLRQTVFDAPLAQAINDTAYAGTITVQRGRGYVAPPLKGIWASAPYLHNGSVPTLFALLTPAARPARFQVGGHALDFVEMGIALTEEGAYRAGYSPFSTPVWIDTQRAGYGNQGHRYGEGLTDPQKRDLIAFLKRV